MSKILMGGLMAAAALSAYALQPLGGFAYGDAAAPAGTEWQDPQALGLNKEQPHAYFFNFASLENALKVLPQNSEYYRSLDGTWKFHWTNHPDKRETDFYKPGFDTAGWDDIQVPGCWNVQGLQPDGSQKYGKPIYVNQPAPFVTRRVPDDWREGVMREPADTTWTVYRDRNEVGAYRRSFTVPAEWKGREVYINFDGVDSFFYIWINGKYVGFSTNSRNLAQFNITRFLNPKGDNTVALEVYRYSDSGMLENQDMFRLPGVFRSTYLTSTPQAQIQDLVVRTTIPVDANPLGKATAQVNIDATLRNLGGKDLKDCRLRYSIYPVELYSDATGEEVMAKTLDGNVTLPKESSKEISASLTLPDANLWSAERPNRYVLVAQLLDKKGNAVETVSTYFGVRQVEIRDTEAKDDEFGLAGRYFYVNNRPVKLKGVNRHENNLATGHTLSHEQMENEVMLMKRANINHVRNSHYNDDPYWYILCDKYGIYLEDEANLESHEYAYGDASLSHPAEWRDAHVARNMEMVHAHVNHPSIVIWSLGNEAGPGHNFVEAYDAIKAFDTSRPVQYERNNNIVDMGSNQYPSINWVRYAVKGDADIKYPFHISEYAHSMGNALGGFNDYWDAMESTNFFCGGAIWDWVDQALWNHTPDGTRYMAYGGDFGDRPNQGMFCMNGILFPDFTPKPQYHEVKRVHQYVGVTPIDINSGTVEVFNKNYFTPLSDLSPRWILTRNGVEVARSEDVERPRMDIGPRSSQTWRIPYDHSKIAGDKDGEYFVTLQFLLNEDKPWAEKGYVQAEVQIPVKDAESFAPLAVEAAGDVEISQGPEYDVISGPGYKITLDNATGSISSLSYDGQTIIAEGNGPQLDAFRAPVDNDAPLYQRWFANGLHNLHHKALSHDISKREDGAVVARYTVESQAPESVKANGGGESGTYTLTPGRAMGEDDFKFTTDQIWTIYPDGTVELSAAINSNNHDLILPRLGYAMTLPSELSEYTYYGRGPVNSFGDRLTSQQVGLYKSTVADQFVAFPKPQSMGNREDVRWNALTDKKGNGVQFIATNGAMSASALPWNDMEMTAAAHPHELPASKGTFLHLDKKVTGLGGASCGQGITLEEYRTMAGPQHFGFMMRPVKAGADLQARASVASAGEHPLIINRDSRGAVSIQSADPEAMIMYSVTPAGTKVNGKGSKKGKATAYDGAFNLREGGKVTAWLASTPDRVTTAEFTKIEVAPIEVLDASSERTDEGPAAAAADGNPDTYWHTNYGVTLANYPHWLLFDLLDTKDIKGFTYLPRQDGPNGDFKDWMIEVSADKENWKKVAEGTFENNKSVKKVTFAPVKGRYVRFTGLSSQNGADFGACAEFTVLAD